MQFLLFWEEEFYDLTTLKDKNFALKYDESVSVYQIVLTSGLWQEIFL